MRVKELIIFITVFVIVYVLLHYLSVVVELSLCFIAIWVTDYILQKIKDPFSSRSLLPRVMDKAVLITGCDTGFGHELARRLDSIGVKVFAGCLLPEGPGAQKLKAQCSSNLHVLQLDISNEEHIQNALKDVNSSLGEKKLWAIVNNAATITFAELELCPLESLKNVINVNVFGTFRTTQAFLPLIRKSRGRIVVVISIAGRYTMNGLMAYSMSKHAQVALADGLRREMMKFGVTVHTIEPWMYRNRISSADLLQQCLRKNWSKSPRAIIDDYGGEEFLQESVDFLIKGEKHYNPASNTHEIVDDMIYAAVGKNPKIRYEKGCLWIIKLLMYLPMSWLDYFTYLNAPKKVNVISYHVDPETNNLTRNVPGQVPTIVEYLKRILMGVRISVEYRWST